MMYQLQRHPLPVTAWFRHTLVLTYAIPVDVAESLLPPGLTAETYRDRAFIAVALVQTEHLRPAWLPAVCGQNFFLAGYRVFARFKTASGHTLRGLRILRSDTDRRAMVTFGNLLTHYNYRQANVIIAESPRWLRVQTQTPDGRGDLDVVAYLASCPAPLPAGSPFANLTDARRFAGPLPFTFDYEPQTHSIVVIEGVRQNWQPQPVRVEVRRNSFLNQPPLNACRPVLANAFYLAGVPYAWNRGVRHELPERKA